MPASAKSEYGDGGFHTWGQSSYVPDRVQPGYPLQNQQGQSQHVLMVNRGNGVVCEMF